MFSISLASTCYMPVISSKLKQQKCLQALSTVLRVGAQNHLQLRDYCLLKFPTIICTAAFEKFLLFSPSYNWSWDVRVTGHYSHLLCTFVYFSHFLQRTFIIPIIRGKIKWGQGHASISEKRTSKGFLCGVSPVNNSRPGWNWGIVLGSYQIANNSKTST